MKFNRAEQWMGGQVGAEMLRIERVSITPSKNPVTSKPAAVLICSYNWRKSKKPSIYVPGSAPSWIQKDLPMTVPPDSGKFFIDQNTAKFPKYPFEVVFSAAQIARPEYRFDDIDVLVNRNSLRKLLEFCHGRNQDSFRIDLYTVQDTLIMERRVKNATELIRGSVRSGFGHNFERSCTEQQHGLEDSTSHHRVLEYMFGSLKVAVRFEVDASYKMASNDPLQDNTKEPDRSCMTADPTQLNDQLMSLRLSARLEKADRGDPQSIIISRAGTGTNQTTTTEMKTGKKPLSKILPQMWFGRTPYLIQGRHQQGVFDRIDIKCVQEELANWESEDENQQALRKMEGLLMLLKSTIKQNCENAAILIFQRSCPDQLRILQQRGRKKALPDWAITSFWRESA